jgi:membrane protease YdiL (CAAX protease family)
VAVVNTVSATNRASAVAYAKPIVAGVLIVAAGVLPWTVLSELNARVRPELPWAGVVTLAYLAVLMAWLNGRGAPRRTAEERRHRLRLWPPVRNINAEAGSLSVWLVGFLLVLLYVAWVATARLSPLPDLAAYPTTSYRWSMFIMGGVLAGVVEEAAYRGYMQTGLEKVDPANALVITSLVFAVSHITHGIGAVLLLGPGLFVAAMLYGILARRTGTILPGMLIHVLGDLSHTFFGVLRGDPGLLFVS